MIFGYYIFVYFNLLFGGEDMVNVSPDELKAKLSYEVAVYKQQLALIQKEVEQISKTTSELMNTINTIENLDSNEVLYTLGGGCFMKGKIEDSSKVLISIGAGYFVYLSKNEAVRELNRRKDAAKVASEKLIQEFNKINSKLTSSAHELKKVQETIEKRGGEIKRNCQGNIRGWRYYRGRSQAAENDGHGIN